MHQFGYDQNKRLVSITDRFGNQVTVERDANGTPTAIVSPDNIRTDLLIDADNHLSQVVYPDGSTYDFEYTAGGLMTTEIDPNGNHFEHIFDDIGRLTDVSDPEGGNWNYSRSVLNNSEVHTQVTSAEGDTLSYQDHTYSGVYDSTIIDEAGDQTQYSRSADQLSVSKVLPCGTNLDFTYDLDPEFLFKFISASTATMPSDNAIHVTKNRSYEDTDTDGIMDLITTTRSVNNKTTTVVKNTLTSQITRTSPEARTFTIDYDPNTLLKTNLSVTGLLDTQYSYDSRGRLTHITTDTRETIYTYNNEGFIDSITDPENQTTSYTYDPIGRIIAVDRPDSSALDFTYDPNGNMTVLTNPAVVDHTFSFNQVDKPSGYQIPISGNYSYIYDKDRKLTQTNFPSGRQINNIYSASQLIQIQTPEGNIDLTYSCGSKVDSMTKSGETIDYVYDGGLLTDVIQSGTLNQCLNYTYNNDFDVTTFIYAGGTTTFSYDLDGMLTGAGEFTITRNDDNGLPESVAGNGLIINRSFNGHAELDNQTMSVSSQPAMQWSLTHDNTGRIITKSETVAGVTCNYGYTYDNVGRLLSVTQDGTLVEQYGYDLTGTRITETNTLRGISGRSLSYSDEDHLLTTGTATYQYDLDGFLTTKTDGAAVTAYNYSSRGELLQVDLPDGRVVTYDHDPLGRRIAKRIDGAIVEKYLWKGLTKLLAVYDGADNLIQRFEYADSRLPVAMTQGGSAYFLVYDQVGTLKVVTDASGNVVKRIDYDTFGNILSDTDSSFSVPFGFAGGLHDRDTGLVRFGFRDYDPDIGRWTAKDPIGFAGGDADLYGYVQNNPVNLIDPTGEFFQLGTAFAGAIGGAIVNGAYAYMKGESVWKGAAVGAGAGFLAGFTLNPYLAGALIGAANTAGNIATGIDNPCNNVEAILKGAAFGAIGGGLGGNLGETLGHEAPAIGRALGEVIGANTINVGLEAYNVMQN